MSSEKTLGNLKLNVKGMTCQGCVRAVTNAILALDHDAKVSVDLQSGKVDIMGYKSSSHKGDFVKAVEDAGFDVVD